MKLKLRMKIQMKTCSENDIKSLYFSHPSSLPTCPYSLCLHFPTPLYFILFSLHSHSVFSPLFTIFLAPSIHFFTTFSPLLAQSSLSIFLLYFYLSLSFYFLSLCFLTSFTLLFCYVFVPLPLYFFLHFVIYFTVQFLSLFSQ